MEYQEIIAYALVIVAVGFLIKKTIGNKGKSKDKSCGGGGCGCS